MEKRSRRGQRLFRTAMAAVLACGLMMPVGAFATDEDEAASQGSGAATKLLLGERAKAVLTADGETGAHDLSAGVSVHSANPFTVAGGTEGAESGGGDYYYDSAAGTLHIRTSTPLTISTAAQTSSNIEIDAGVRADLTLAGVNIATPADGTTSPINMVTNVFDTADEIPRHPCRPDHPQDVALPHLGRRKHQHAFLFEQDQAGARFPWHPLRMGVDSGHRRLRA